MNKKYPGFKGAIKSFFSREYITKTAVDDISFTINDGEIVRYIGANGAGKFVYWNYINIFSSYYRNVYCIYDMA